MTTSTELLSDGFGRVHEGVRMVVDGLEPDELSHRVAPGANTVGWLVWHLLRVQDAQVAGSAGNDQAWTADGWDQRFGLPFDPGATGYGQSADEVGQVTGISAELLAAYADAVAERTQAYLVTLDDDTLDRVVDESWDPPVTVAVRLVSILADDLKHLGQAEYVRGLL